MEKDDADFQRVHPYLAWAMKPDMPRKRWARVGIVVGHFATIAAAIVAMVGLALLIA